MKATFFVQFEKRGHRVKAIHMTQKRPFVPIGGTVLVKFTADLDDAFFATPEVSVFVPAEHGVVTAASESSIEGLDIVLDGMDRSDD